MVLARLPGWIELTEPLMRPSSPQAQGWWSSKADNISGKRWPCMMQGARCTAWSCRTITSIGMVRSPLIPGSFSAVHVRGHHIIQKMSTETSELIKEPTAASHGSCPEIVSAWRKTHLFIAKFLWDFDVKSVPGEKVVLDHDFHFYAMWDKPKVLVRFQPIAHE